MTTVQVIQKAGRPEWAVIPYDQYERMLEALEDLDDLKAFDDAKARLEGGEDLVPSEVTFAILDGVRPIRAWREYRGLTQQQLAAKSGISKPYLSQLESGKRSGTTEVIRSLAEALSLEVDDLLT